MKLYRNFIIILSITFISCSAKMDFGDNSEDIKRKADLVIISTCDIHAAIDQIPKLATLVNRKRQENKNVLLVDAGDQWTGNAHVDYAYMPGKPMIELMNHLSYDAATLGNHSFDYGQLALNDNIKYAQFKIICANISGNNILEEPEPYTFIKIGDWKIALLGLLNVDKTTHRTTACVSKLDNLGFEDPVVLAKQFKSLGAKADMFITLSHCGEETDSIICSKVPEMNLIIGGHSHTANKEQKEFYGVVVTHAGSRLEYAGVTEVWFNKKGGIICKNHLENLDDYATDENFQTIVDEIKSRNDFSKIIGYNDNDLNIDGLALLLCNSMLSRNRSKVAIYNLHGIGKKIQKKGNMTLEDLYNIEPYKNYHFKVKMSYNALRDMLRDIYNAVPVNKRGKEIHTEGMEYEYSKDGKGNAIDVEFTVDGKLIKNYTTLIDVSMNEYLYENYKKYMTEDVERLGLVIYEVINYYKR